MIKRIIEIQHMMMKFIQKTLKINGIHESKYPTIITFEKITPSNIKLIHKRTGKAYE